jgi:hypothetical protein
MTEGRADNVKGEKASYSRDRNIQNILMEVKKKGTLSLNHSSYYRAMDEDGV